MLTYPSEKNSGVADVEDRERLVLEHLPLVQMIAHRFYDRLPRSVALDDLVSTGVVGLISAIDNFDPSQGVQLRTYAEYKIRGAILDSLRGLDWPSRHRRKKAKTIETAIDSASQRLQRAPNEDEVAHEMGINIDDYHALVREVQGLSLVSLDVSSTAGGAPGLLSVVPDKSEAGPDEVLERSELERLLADTIDRMPEIERTILSLYYKDELLLREIAEIVDMRITRVSELKTQAILRLRAVMTRKWPSMRRGSDLAWT